MKYSIAVMSLLLCAPVFATEAPGQPGTPAPNAAVHRFMVERSFPPGALAGLDAATKEKVNAKNASVGVRWLRSYANADKTKTFCIYDGPSPEAIHAAAGSTGLPVDSVSQVSVLDPYFYH